MSLPHLKFPGAFHLPLDGARLIKTELLAIPYTYLEFWLWRGTWHFSEHLMISQTLGLLTLQVPLPGLRYSHLTCSLPCPVP